MQKGMSTFPTRDGYAVSGADREATYEDETDDKEYQACVLPL